MGRLFSHETSDIPRFTSSYVDDNSSANSNYDYASFPSIDPEDGQRDVQHLDELITQQYHRNNVFSSTSATDCKTANANSQGISPSLFDSSRASPVNPSYMRSPHTSRVPISPPDMSQPSLVQQHFNTSAVTGDPHSSVDCQIHSTHTKITK